MLRLTTRLLPQCSSHVLMCSAWNDEHDRVASLLACIHAVDAADYTSDSAVNVFADPSCALTTRVAYYIPPLQLQLCKLVTQLFASISCIDVLLLWFACLQPSAWACMYPAEQVIATELSLCVIKENC